jgi:hypothetical protein
LRGRASFLNLCGPLQVRFFLLVFSYNIGFWLRLRYWGGSCGSRLRLFLLSSGPRGARRGGRLNLLDEVARKDALALGTARVSVHTAIPVIVFLFCDGDDLASVEIQIVLVWRGVFVEGLDAEQGGHCGGLCAKHTRGYVADAVFDSCSRCVVEDESGENNQTSTRTD